MTKHRGKSSDVSERAIDWASEFGMQIRSSAHDSIKMLQDFHIRQFSEDSLEAKRPDHAERVAALEAAAKTLEQCAKRVLFDDADFEDVKHLVDAMSTLRASVQRVYSVESWAWTELRMKLQDAKTDPAIEFNPEVVKFIDSMIVLVQPAAGHWDLNRVLDPIETRLRSEQASKAASMKNLNVRTWVWGEWINRSDRGQSKASFARQYAPLVKKRFGVDVTPEQISRAWLPKG